ncbi:MAG: ABC transporter ATP-binding protein [Simkaniaceae bacterium]|nr:ABC transporter ATP-binding protein [Simkaniaceae bacterium]
MSEPLLELKGLRVTFRQRDRSVYAVRNVSFSLRSSETLAIVGESGCGKTITAKAILGLINSPALDIESGEILYKGQDLLKLSENEMQAIRGKEIGMIFQDPMTSLNPTMKIGRQITEGMIYHNPKITKEEAYRKGIELLRLVGISEPEVRFHQYPHELSGGMRQRVMIAIALAPAPKILIADEPTTALDVTIQAQILELLKEIQAKTKTSIIFITHDLSIVSNISHRVLVMYAGRIIEMSETDQLYATPSHPYTQRLLKSIPRIDTDITDELTPIEGAPPDMSEIPLGCPFAPRCESPMNICIKQLPPLFKVEDKEQCAACWNHDARATKRAREYETTTANRQESEEVFSR